MHEAKYRSWQPTYISWARMIKRCTDPKNNRYYRYGARGITVCKRWMKYENFLADMGERPADMSLDRIDNDKNYYKANCRWATRSQQARNKSTSVFVNGLHLQDAAKSAGLTRTAIQYRVAKGWVKADLLRPDLYKDARYIGSVEYCKLHGISRTTLGRRRTAGTIIPDFVSKGGRIFFLKQP